MAGVLLSSCNTDGHLESWDTTDLPFSLYKFRALHGWTTIALYRLFSQWRQNKVRSILIEKIDPFPEADVEDETFRRVLPNTFHHSDQYRVAAFNQPKPPDESVKSLPADACVGFCVVKVNCFSSGRRERPVVFESVSPPNVHENSFPTCAHDYRCRIQGREFSVRGLYYCQQNGVTNVCLHAALKMLCHGRRPFLPLMYHEIDAVLNTELKGLGDISGGHRKGLSTGDIEKFLDAKDIGYSMHVYRGLGGKYVASKFPYYKYIYASIETGCPSLLVFRSSDQARHVITALGHTFNEDAYRPLAETGYHRLSRNIGYIPSEQWMSNLIVHDDNFGGEHCLPTHYFNTLRIGYVLGTLPDGAVWDPKEAEVAGVGYLYSCLEFIEGLFSNVGPWCGRLVPAMKNHSVAVRTVHMHKDEYLQHITSPKQTPPEWPVEKVGAEFKRHLRAHLPDAFYAVEFGLPDVFSANRRKLWPTMLTGISNHLPLFTSGG